VRSVYIETTVVSYYSARSSRDVVVVVRQDATRRLRKKLLTEYACFVSVLVRQEASSGDQSEALRRLETIKSLFYLGNRPRGEGSGLEAKVLAQRIVSEHGVPTEYPEDALHIAATAVNGIDVLLTWNFAHLNNPFTRARIRRIVEGAGYVCPEVCSPDELLESTDD
jgi:hypothetical protein